MESQSDIAADASKYQTALESEELPALLRKIDAYDQEQGDVLTRLALQLTTATFVRTSEPIGA